MFGTHGGWSILVLVGLLVGCASTDGTVSAQAGLVAHGAGQADHRSPAEHRAALEQCVSDAREQDPELAGSITFDMVIGPEGYAQEVRVGDERLGNPWAIGCLQKVMYTGAYPAAGKPYPVSETLHFAPYEAPAAAYRGGDWPTVEATIQDAIPAIEACYGGREFAPGEVLEFKILFKVDRRGATKDSVLLMPSSTPELACAEGVVQQLRFPRPAKGKAKDFQYELSWFPGGPPVGDAKTAAR